MSLPGAVDSRYWSFSHRSLADSSVTGPQRKSFRWLRNRFCIRRDTEGSRFATATSSFSSSSSSSSSRRGRGAFNPGWRLSKCIFATIGQVAGFGKSLRRLPLPDGQQLRRGLGTDSVVGQDLVLRRKDIPPGEDQVLGAAAREGERDEVALGVAK